MATIKDAFVIIAMSIAAIGVIILFVTSIANDNGGAITDTRINTAYAELNQTASQFDATRQEIENMSNSIREADVGDFAYFGIRGMVDIMRMPLSLISFVRTGTSAVTHLFSNYVPISLLNAIGVVVGIIVLFAAIKFITSRGQEP